MKTPKGRGPLPTGIVSITVLVAVAITVTVPVPGAMSFVT